MRTEYTSLLLALTFKIIILLSTEKASTFTKNASFKTVVKEIDLYLNRQLYSFFFKLTV